MTKEEKLEEAKRLYKTANADQRYVLESLFPELAESEDERIRKVLIDYFNRYKEQEECGVKTFYGIPTGAILAWLEKQTPKPKWSEEDEHHWMMCLECVEECATQERADFSKTISWLKSIKQRMGGEK